MSKYRKSSLSPCWNAITTNASNKENLNIQNVVSFKNMAANKKSHSKKHDFSPHHVDGYASIYTNAYRQLNFDESNLLIADKMSKWVVNGPQVNQSKEKSLEEQRHNMAKMVKNDQEYRDVIKSKDKQISSLHSQVKVLQNTIELLKTQVDGLSKQNKILNQGPRGQTRVELEKLTRQNASLKVELRQYQQIVPKLNQLEIIQNALVEQNRLMKARQQKVKIGLKEVQVLLGSGCLEESSVRICQVMSSLIN